MLEKGPIQVKGPRARHVHGLTGPTGHVHGPTGSPVHGPARPLPRTVQAQQPREGPAGSAHPTGPWAHGLQRYGVRSGVLAPSSDARSL